MTITIDSNVRIPQAKTTVERVKAQASLFRAFANAYQAVHVRRPVLTEVTDAGMFRIDVLPQAVSAKRLKELTGMLKQRAKDL